MLKDKLSKESVALYGLGGLIVIFAGYALIKGLARPAPIVFENTPSVSASQPPRADTEVKAPDSPPQEVVVHVVGAVKQSGLLRLPPDSRVEDAIVKAGGAAADADLENVNLAAKLIDGTQLAVPHKGKAEEVAKVADAYQGGSADAYQAQPIPEGRPEGSARGSAPKSPTGPVSLNTASSAQLQSLPGVGPSTAQKILDYRQEHGGFTSVDELLAVKGIGPKKLQALRKWLRL